MRILARICGVNQGLDLLLGLDFPTWVVAGEIRMSLKQDTRRDKLGSLRRLLIFVSISLVKLDQSTPFLRHLGSANLQDDFVDQLLPQREMLGVLSFPVIRLVRVAEPCVYK